MMILGLTGLPGSGKDTVAGYLIKQHGFERRAFADPLKRSFAALFDIPYHEIDKIKNEELSNIAVRWSYWDSNDRSPDPAMTAGQSRQFSIREALQRYGTESHRDVFGEDFWVDQTLPVDGFYHGRTMVITDLRFQNEVDRVKLLGGHVVRIIRPDIPEPNTHRSNQYLEADYTLDNAGSMSKLFDAVDDLLITISEEQAINVE